MTITSNVLTITVTATLPMFPLTPDSSVRSGYDITGGNGINNILTNSPGYFVAEVYELGSLIAVPSGWSAAKVPNTHGSWGDLWYDRWIFTYTG